MAISTFDNNSMHAKNLHGFHVGQPVTFDWQFPGSGVDATIRGTIVEIHHTSSLVTLWLTPPVSDTGDKSGFELEPQVMVEVTYV